jgi:hypothetical protein
MHTTAWNTVTTINDYLKPYNFIGYNHCIYNYNHYVYNNTILQNVEKFSHRNTA